jgi:putative cobalt transporter subunit CbtA
VVEIRVILRGVLAGAVAGVLGFVFEHIFAEPLITKSIDYGYGRDRILTALNHAAGRPFSISDPEIFSRATQSTVGAATGIIGFSVAMGALVAVVYLVLHGRFGVRPQNLAWAIAGFGFLGVYLLPFVKYPANPPAIGHPFTITTRGQLYLTMVIGSLVLLGLAAFLGRRLAPRFGAVGATVLAAVAFCVAYSILIGVLPSLGDLNANLAQVHQFGYARAATETPQPITNILSRPLTIAGRTYAPGQLVYPGFDADVLWKFRWYSVINQALIWTVIALGFGALLDRLTRPRPRPAAEPDRQPVQAAP